MYGLKFSALIVAGLLVSVMPSTAAPHVHAAAAKVRPVASQASGQVVIDCTKIRVRPHRVTFCANTADELMHITWRNWNRHSARGRGTYRFDDCKPDCASGTNRHPPVRVWLHRIHVVNGHRRFSRVTWTYRDGSRSSAALVTQPGHIPGQGEADKRDPHSFGFVYHDEGLKLTAHEHVQGQKVFVKIWLRDTANHFIGISGFHFSASYGRHYRQPAAHCGGHYFGTDELTAGQRTYAAECEEMPLRFKRFAMHLRSHNDGTFTWRGSVGRS